MATPVPSKTPVPSAAPAPRPAVAAPPRPAPNAPANDAKPAPSRLGSIRKRKLGLFPRILIYGPEGVGKSTIAADADALFLDIEGGSGELEAARYSFNPDQKDEFKSRSYEQTCEAVEDLIAHPMACPPAVAIDTGDALEAQIHAYLCKKHKVDSIEKVGGGFGKGYRAAIEELRRFQSRLDLVRAHGVTVIVLAHSTTTTFKNPEGEDFDRYQLKMNDSRNASFAAQMKEWCEVVGFLHFEGGSSKLKDDESRDKRARGWSTNRRMMQLERAAAWDAKWRLTVPMALEFEVAEANPWAPFADAIVRARIAALSESITAELDRIGADEFTTAAGRATTRQAVIDMLTTSDADHLTRVLAGLVATPAATLAAKES